MVEGIKRSAGPNIQLVDLFYLFLIKTSILDWPMGLQVGHICPCFVLWYHPIHEALKDLTAFSNGNTYNLGISFEHISESDHVFVWPTRDVSSLFWIFHQRRNSSSHRDKSSVEKKNEIDTHFVKKF